MRVFIAAAILVACIVGSNIGSYALGLHALHQSQQALCPIVRLALQHPVPYPKDPAANPSRVAAWQSYQDFVIVDRQYRCGG